MESQRVGHNFHDSQQPPLRSSNNPQQPHDLKKCLQLLKPPILTSISIIFFRVSCSTASTSGDSPDQNCSPEQQTVRDQRGIKPRKAQNGQLAHTGL